ncbi:MAG: TonB-dependent receptor, partial [Crocinitomicaceae bacterium]|nr:TonB-dependent receptor [Crocinitomicaceae bacterium]
HNVKLYVYPAINVDSGELYGLNNIKLPENLTGLLTYMQANDKIAAIPEYNERLLHILSDDVLSKIKAGAASWEDDVPYEVVQAIKFFELFGYQKKAVLN